ncbi:MAG: WD40 repeat domain-containing protein [Planctomycetaceae bacterium]
MPIDPAKAHEVLKVDYGSPFLSCRFDPTGRFVLAGAEDNSILRWELATNQKTALAKHDSWVHALAFSHDGATVVSGGCDGRLIWWPAAAETPEPIRIVDAHQGWVRGLVTSPDGQFLLSGGNDRAVKLWNLADGTLIREFTGHDSHVYSVCFHPSGEIALSGDLHGNVHQWEVATSKLMRSFDAKALWSYNGGQGVDFGGVRALAVSADGKSLAAGGLFNASNPLGAVHDPLVLLFDWESQKVLQQHIADGLKGSIWRVVFHPDGWLIGVSGGSTGGHVLFWKPDQNKEFHRYQLPNIARDLDLHPDQIRIVVAHHDRHLRVSQLTAKAT